MIENNEIMIYEDKDRIMKVNVNLLKKMFGLFILEESLRLEKSVNSKPLIVFKIDTNLDTNDIEYTEEVYYSLVFKLTRKYLKDEKSYDDNLMYRAVLGEFFVFNKFRLWVCVS